MKVQNFALSILLISFATVLAQYPDTAITTNPLDQNEVTIAISPLNSNNLVATWNDYRLGIDWEPGFAFSIDGGNNWSEGIVPDTLDFTAGVDPSCAFDNFGNAFYCYLAQDTNSAERVILVSSTTTFTPQFIWHHALVNDSVNVYRDKPYMAVDNTDQEFDGRIYVSWMDFINRYRIRFSFSVDGGKSFSQNITLDSTNGTNSAGAYFNPPPNIPPGNPSQFVQGPVPAVGPNGELYVVWMDVEDFTSHNGGIIRIRKSIDGGESFSTEVAVDSFTWDRGYWGAIDHSNLPSIAVDRSNDYVYVAFKDRFPHPDSLPRIKFVRSTDGGNNWSQTQTIGNLGEQGEVFPWVACDAYGKIVVTFLHRDYDDSVGCYVVESYDHGANFRSAILVSDTSFNPFIASGRYHHYQGIVLDNVGNDYVVWADQRNGNYDPYFAKVNTPPEPPQNLISSVVGENDNPRIDWDANQETDLDYYEVWKKKGDGIWNLYATTSNNYYIDDEESNVKLSECVDCIPIYYKLKAVDLAGNLSDFSNTVGFSSPKGEQFRLSDLQGDSVVLATPDHFAIIQNYPNPFNPTTTIRYQLRQTSDVTLSIYNVLGQKVRTLINSPVESGYYSIEWDGRDDTGTLVGSGIYIYRFSAGDFYEIRKMILIK